MLEIVKKYLESKEKGLMDFQNTEEGIVIRKKQFSIDFNSVGEPLIVDNGFMVLINFKLEDLDNVIIGLQNDLSLLQSFKQEIETI